MWGPSSSGNGFGGLAAGVVTSLAVAAPACSAGDERRSDDARAAEIQAAGDPQPPIGRLRPGEPCPVTAPMAASSLPPVLAAEADSSWYGEDELWVSVPVDQARSAVRVNGRYTIKFATVTLQDGQLTSDYGTPEMRIRRLDGRGTARSGFGGYATTGEYDEPFHFWPTGIDFSDSGCWAVTGTLRDTTIRFVLRVG